MDDGEAAGTGHRSKSPWIWLVAIGLVAAAAWFWLRGDRPPAESPLALPPPVAVEPEPLIRHPIPEPRGEALPDGGQAEPSPLAGLLPASLPDLDRSDQALLAIADRLIGNPQLAELLIPKELIRRIVITVDGLGGDVTPPAHRPVTGPEGPLPITRSGERIYLDPRNFERYHRHVALVDRLDAAALAGAYVHFYPLFQQAYRELGYPQGSFNDRLIAVIDEILAAPAAGDRIELEQPSVFYLYADPELEALTAGQRLLLRIGPDNAAAIKRKLREIRSMLAQ